MVIISLYGYYNFVIIIMVVIIIVVVIIIISIVIISGGEFQLSPVWEWIFPEYLPQF